jgi:hypothetical protein
MIKRIIFCANGGVAIKNRIMSESWRNTSNDVVFIADVEYHIPANLTSGFFCSIPIRP